MLFRMNLNRGKMKVKIPTMFKKKPTMFKSYYV